MSSLGTFSVHLACDAEWTAGELLLPHAFEDGLDLRLFLATTEIPYQILGAAALDCAILNINAPAFRGAIEVAPPFRRQGVGRTLAKALIEFATETGVGMVTSWRPLEHPEVDAFVASLGGRALKTFTSYRIDLVHFHHTLSAIVDRLAARNKPLVSEDSRIVNLADVHHPKIVRLHARYLGGSPEILLPRLRGDNKLAYSRELSKVLLRRGEVAGMLLARRQGAILFVESKVVEDGHRGGAADLALMHATAAHALTVGCTHTEFQAEENNSHTHKLATRCQAAPVRITSMFAVPTPTDDSFKET